MSYISCMYDNKPYSSIVSFAAFIVMSSCIEGRLLKLYSRSVSINTDLLTVCGYTASMINRECMRIEICMTCMMINNHPTVLTSRRVMQSHIYGMKIEYRLIYRILIFVKNWKTK